MTVRPLDEQAIFEGARNEQTAELREAYLDQHCGTDAELRRRIESLLRAYDEGQSFLESPPPELRAIAIDGTDSPTIERSIAECPGTVIGPYKLLQQIGEGGMGVVFMAEQTEPIQRTVALKIIKPGMDTRQVIARFEAERQALALMDHPNIARVIDAGTTNTGRPYFVMELVKGVPITKYCDEKHLSLRERMELFMPVCQAVQHAHQKGIIHRDIKPTNVLVTEYDNRAVPKVIDFGVAKATAQKLTERTMFTEFGQLVGTFEYMSPEQAKLNQLDIDTRSDIYSLGVLLYELLTGSTPFEQKRFREAAFDEVLRIIREEEPPKPSTKLSSSDTLPAIAANRHTEPARLSKDVRGELDWIVMKALEKDRNRRYETANGFAMDVERYLADEPVLACPPSAGYRFRKFARRNKGPVLAASLVLLSLVGGMLGTTFGLIRAEKAWHAEAEQRKRAEANEQKALASAESEKTAKRMAEIREVHERAVLDFVQNKIFAAARPQGQDGGLGNEVTLRKAVEASLPFVERSFANHPLIEARLRDTLGTSFLFLGDAKIAAEQFEAAHRLFTQHLGPDHADTLVSMNNLANSYFQLGRDADALALYEQTLTLRKTKLGPDHPNTLSSMTNLANGYYALGRYAEALETLEDVTAIQKAKLGPDHPNTLASMNNLARTYSALGRHVDAVKLHEETLALFQGKLGPDHPHTLMCMGNLANDLGYLGRHAEALKLHEETLALRKARLGPDHTDTLLSASCLANCFEAVGRHTEALKLREDTLAQQKAKLGVDHPDTIGSMSNLANSFEALGRHAEALQLREETLALMKVKLGPDHPDTLTSMHNLAISYNAMMRPADAIKLYNETLTLRRAKLGPDHPHTLSSMWGLAESLVNVGRGAEAVDIVDDFVRRAEGQVVDPLLIPAGMELRLRHFQKLKDVAGCRETAVRWEELKRADPQSLYQSACFRAVCAAVIRETDRTPAGEANAIQQTDQAMAWLKQAIAAGFTNVALIKTDKDLDALRDREDFKKLLSELERNKG
jgi:serine/threonine protein kinase/tetratricopeptide (TPR) repeat protein